MQTTYGTNSSKGFTLKVKHGEMTNPLISVIVCHHKGDFIYRFYESLKKSIAVTYECIIVTSDKNIDYSRLPGTQIIITEPELMPASKRNLGSEIAKSGILAFFDDDVELDPMCLYEQWKYVGHGMTYGKLYKADERDRLDEAGGYLTWNGFIWSRAEQNIKDVGQFNITEPIFAGKSASCMIEKKLFNDIGRFDEDFGILGEESDLSWRVWLYGRSVMFVPSSIAYHYFNTRLKPAKEFYTSKRVHYNGSRNYITMLLKNLGKEHLCIAYTNIIIWFFVGIAMIGTLKVSQGVNILKGIRYVIRNWSTIMRKREIIQNQRIVRDNHIKHFIYRKVKFSYYLKRLLRYLRIGLHG